MSLGPWMSDPAPSEKISGQDGQYDETATPYVRLTCILDLTPEARLCHLFFVYSRSRSKTRLIRERIRCAVRDSGPALF